MAKAKISVDVSGRRYVRIDCPGCKDSHVLPFEDEKRPVWSFNGDLSKPTLSPSILAKCGHYIEGREGKPCWCRFEDSDFSCYVCHSYVRNGMIEFLSDCTHGLAGTTVELPEID